MHLNDHDCESYIVMVEPPIGFDGKSLINEEKDVARRIHTCLLERFDTFPTSIKQGLEHFLLPYLFLIASAV